MPAEYIKVLQLIQDDRAYAEPNVACLGCAHHTPEYEEASLTCRELCAQHNYEDGEEKHPCYRHIWIEDTPKAIAEYTALRLAGEAAVMAAYTYFYAEEN